MANPPFVICDTDGLIQLLLTRELRPLRFLRSKYSIQPLVVPEVEIELRSNKRFAARIAPDLRKALESELIKVLDKAILETHYGGPPGGPLAAAAALREISKIGRQNSTFVDTGEAYTLSAASVLGMPAFSNDKTALEALLKSGLSVPATVLRTFDLIALCQQVSEISEEDCEEFRRKLLSENEGVPACFKNYSYRNGIREFSPRIRDSRLADVGLTDSEDLPYSRIIEL